MLNVALHCGLLNLSSDHITCSSAMFCCSCLLPIQVGNLVGGTKLLWKLSVGRQCSLQKQACKRYAVNDCACCAADLIGPVSQRLDVEVIRDSQEGSAVSHKPHMLLCTCAVLRCAVLCCAALCCAVQCSCILSCAALCCAVLYYLALY